MEPEKVNGSTKRSAIIETLGHHPITSLIEE